LEAWCLWFSKASLTSDVPLFQNFLFETALGNAAEFQLLAGSSEAHRHAFCHFKENFYCEMCRPFQDTIPSSNLHSSIHFLVKHAIVFFLQAHQIVAHASEVANHLFWCNQEHCQWCS